MKRGGRGGRKGEEGREEEGGKEGEEKRKEKGVSSGLYHSSFPLRHLPSAVQYSHVPFGARPLHVMKVVELSSPCSLQRLHVLRKEKRGSLVV